VNKNIAVTGAAVYDDGIFDKISSSVKKKETLFYPTINPCSRQQKCCKMRTRGKWSVFSIPPIIRHSVMSQFCWFLCKC